MHTSGIVCPAADSRIGEIPANPSARLIVIKWWDSAIHCSTGFTGGDILRWWMPAHQPYSELGWGDFTPLDTTVLLGQPERASVCSRSWRCYRPFRAWLPSTTMPASPCYSEDYAGLHGREP